MEKIDLNWHDCISSALFIDLTLFTTQLLLRRSGYNLQTSAEKEVVRQIKEEKCYVSFNPRKEEETPPHADAYRLPDGVTLMVGAERFRAPEILFRPELIGSEEKGR